ncbi:MAG: ferrous iron transport protein A [Gemmatimonadaceae bacterium]|nr:ferrous iron transport protein A [Gemmatimonadaceae bacterium]
MTVIALPIAEQTDRRPVQSCRLGDCASGQTATVVELRCGESEACRLRALGLVEGSTVNIVDQRHCMLLDVRGARLALSHAITNGITVVPSRG